jgi:hypothetical protein
MSHAPGIFSAKVKESGAAASSVPTMTKAGWVIFERALQVPVQFVAASSCCCNICWDIVSLGIGKYLDNLCVL